MYASRKRKPAPVHDLTGLNRRLIEIGAVAEKCSLNAYLVGGAVRDLLSGQTSLDWDIVVEGNPKPLVEALTRKWGAKMISHHRFGTFVLELPNGCHIDFATAREERYPRPGALPEVSSSDLKHDLFRRDFAVNALALALTGDSRGKVIDCYGGLSDLKRHVLRILHENSFRDDPTRLFRLARFAGRGFGIDRQTERRAIYGKRYVRYLSDERVREEILAILAEKNPYPALRLLARWGVLKNVLPGVRLGRQAMVLKQIGSVEGRLHFLLKGLSPASLDKVLGKLKLPRKLKKEVKALLRPVKATVVLSGKDLIGMGYHPGPLFKEILQELARHGRMSRREARRFVFDKFPQKI